MDDGSRDATRDLLAAMHREEPRFKVVILSRNFGQQTAISAGLACASGEAVAILDADLQDPPELIGHCLQKLREGWTSSIRCGASARKTCSEGRLTPCSTVCCAL